MGDPREGLIDRIYEAAALPERWQSVLVEVVRYAGADEGVLFASNLDDARYVTTPGFADIFTRYIEEKWFDRTDRTRRLLARQHAGFLTDFDVFTQDEFERDPIFKDFLWPQGLYSGAASVVSTPTGERLILDVEHAIGKGPVGPEAIARLDDLRPHLNRALFLSARLQFETVQATVQAFDAINLPALAIGRSGQIIAMSQACTPLLETLIRDGRRVGLTGVGEDTLLAEAITRIAQDESPSVRSIPIAARGGQPPMILHLVPIRRAANDVFIGAKAIALFAPLGRSVAPEASLLSQLFDLTAAEARVAKRVAEGETVMEIAARIGITVGTVRSQLKAVMAKTGVMRQADLVGLLSSQPVQPRS